MAKSQAAKAGAARALSETTAIRAPRIWPARIMATGSWAARSGMPARWATAQAAIDSPPGNRPILTPWRSQVRTSSPTPAPSRGRIVRYPSGRSPSSRSRASR